jgi:hypothetical protein
MSQSIASDRISESTVARIAGNIASGHPVVRSDEEDDLTAQCVRIARKIVAEVERTAPKEG